MPAHDLAILTEARYEEPPDTPYGRQIREEARLLQAALGRLGISSVRLDWRRPDLEWSRYRAALFRTTWDYFHRVDEFRQWLARVVTQTRLINTAALVEWNLDKRYLRDLAATGINVVPTVYFKAGDDMTISDWLGEAGWEQAVVKPTVSGSARDTHLIGRADAEQFDTVVRDLVAGEAMMAQPFQRSVMDEGEVSLIVIGGRFTHAVRKLAKPGDFRVQDDHGGTVHACDPTAAQIALGEAAVAACSSRPVYARVDIVRDNHGRPALMELELIEPELFFRLHPPAAEALAVEVARLLG